MGTIVKKVLIISVVATAIWAVLLINKFKPFKDAIGMISAGKMRSIDDAKYMIRNLIKSAPIVDKMPASQTTGSNENSGMAEGRETAREEIIYSGRQNRDPLDNSAVVITTKKEEQEIVVPRQEAQAPFPVEKFSVSAIIWGTKMPQAIINDKIVGIGEQLDEGRIAGIDKGGVHIDYGGKEVLLQINEDKI